MRLIILACEIMYREICYCVSQSKNIVDARFLRKGLHDLGQKEMLQTLQQEIDEVPKNRYEAILLGYGLCSNGISGLKTEIIPLIIPRAHDCITLLLGSKERYGEYFEAHPGTYFRSTGWLERNFVSEEDQGKDIPSQLGLNRTLEEYVAKYGEENAQYLMETLQEWNGLRHYDRITYIDMGIGNFQRYEEEARKEALDKGWKFERLKGDVGLLRRLIDGNWNPGEFLIVQPGQKIVPTYVGGIIKAKVFRSENPAGTP
ncbi:DUF1638 domain-containing protein [Candidatus Aerophobetes bacterium]|nr:DUF1638 domain-containing protein [Candidatus Aerophobetes bacterium]